MQVFYCLILLECPRGIVGHGTYGARCPVSAKGSAQAPKFSFRCKSAKRKRFVGMVCANILINPGHRAPDLSRPNIPRGGPNLLSQIIL